jgi:hypothetical protein
MRLSWVVLLLAGCGAGRQPAAYCDSYELNYLADCQGHCEAETGAASDLKASAACEAKCKADLGGDDNFSDSCPDRAKALR